ncbi:hypothetical protein CYMTET_43631 [Cymbomonas tetramitiformis]|uniref:Orc1-like AAA ATPase domain-containing protein n=1 Tax=Cymbomonas tetramitiformis TaxID=36881 RepID=A0AAE0C1V0_9CHLO|nr:hypothetical protein CYMTET_43631 [Cymbomonas tetramitiformis]
MSREDDVQLHESWPGRKDEINTLLEYVKYQDSSQALFVCGTSSAGKTSVVKAVLEASRARYAYASSFTSTSTVLLLQELLYGLIRQQRGAEDGSQTLPRCGRISDFVQGLKHYAPNDGRTSFLVIDDAERLRDRSTGGRASVKEPIIQVLLRLPELTSGNVGVIVISKLHWQAFRDGNGCLQPLQVYFPEFSDSILKRILVKERDSVISEAKYAAFIEPLFGTFSRTCRGIHELRSVARMLWPKYLAPEAKAGKPLEPRVLWKELMTQAPTYELPRASSLQAGPNRGVHASMTMPLSRAALAVTGEQAIRPGCSMVLYANPDAVPIRASPQVDRLDVDLPWWSKVLLLASYVAARTPADMDKHAFNGAQEDDVAGAGGKRKRASSLSLDRRTEQARAASLSGPRSFRLERLLNIFRRIALDADSSDRGVSKHDLLSADIFVQISSLVSLKLLDRIGTNVLDGTCQYYCNIGEELCQRIAKNVKIPIENYLVYA